MNTRFVWLAAKYKDINIMYRAILSAAAESSFSAPSPAGFQCGLGSAPRYWSCLWCSLTTSEPGVTERRVSGWGTSGSHLCFCWLICFCLTFSGHDPEEICSRDESQLSIWHLTPPQRWTGPLRSGSVFASGEGLGVSLLSCLRVAVGQIESDVQQGSSSLLR